MRREGQGRRASGCWLVCRLSGLSLCPPCRPTTMLYLFVCKQTETRRCSFGSTRPLQPCCAACSPAGQHIRLHTTPCKLNLSLLSLPLSILPPRPPPLAGHRDLLEELMDDEEEFIQLNLSSRPLREERRKQRERERLEREMAGKWLLQRGDVCGEGLP